MSVISVKDFSFTYLNGTNIISHLSFSLEKGEMLLLCGRNGCGKSTLLRSLKPEVAPKGKKSGEISTAGTSLILFQECDKNIIFRSVREDLMFPACNSGMPEQEICRQLARVTELFGIEHLLERNTGELSGGEKQLVALAALVMLEPDLLLLDEPLSQLDEAAKQAFLQRIFLLKERGTAIIISEHNTDYLLEKSEKVMLFCDSGATVYSRAQLAEAPALSHFPAYIQLEQKLGLHLQDFSRQEAVKNINAAKERIAIVPHARRAIGDETALAVNNVRFRYGDAPLLESASLRLRKGEISFLCGKNGCGKSTLAYIICGLLKPISGAVEINCAQRPGYLSQNPMYSFLKDTLRGDLTFALKQNKLSPSLIDEAYQNHPIFKDLEALETRNPFDLSGGERAKAALFKPMLLGKEMLILDEPEKHLDKDSMAALSELIVRLAQCGTAFLIISHSPDFIYRTADSVHVLQDGRLSRYDVEQYFPQHCETSLSDALREACIHPLDTLETEVLRDG